MQMLVCRISVIHCKIQFGQLQFVKSRIVSTIWLLYKNIINCTLDRYITCILIIGIRFLQQFIYLICMCSVITFIIDQLLCLLFRALRLLHQTLDLIILHIE